jgi:hypothetical protein
MPDVVLSNPAAGDHVIVDFKTVTGADLLPYIRKMALDRGRPVSRGDVKGRLSQDGMRLNAKDESNYIGTVLWRARDQFIYLKPHGYWPRDVAYAPAKYDPTQPRDDGPADSDENDRRENGASAASVESSADLWGS